MQFILTECELSTSLMFNQPLFQDGLTQTEHKGWMVVPAIGFDSIVIVRFTNRTRSYMLVRPRPFSCNVASTSKPMGYSGVGQW